MALRTEQKLPIILFVVFLTLSTVGFLFYQSTTSFQEALSWERQTNEVFRLSDETMRLALNIDSGVFGFLHTGNDTYLEPFNQAKQRIPQNIAQLRQLAADDPLSLEEVGRMEAGLKTLLDEAERKIEVRKMKGPEAGLEAITNIRDRPRMEVVQASVRQLKTLATAKLESRDVLRGEGLSRAVWILIGSSIAGILALGFANFVVFREIKKRQSAEVQLTEVNRGLEEKIEDRTAELKVMNDRLLDIGSERELLLKGEKRARQEAEIANRLRDEFMATVSHELRTPLNSILGWARLLKDGSLDNGQSERAVTTIIKNSETQNRLIEDLLDVARIISGKLELATDPVDIFDTVHDSIEIARPAANAKQLNIELNRNGDGSAPVVSGDRNRLRQVFSNLLTNAIKFSHEGEGIAVTVATQDGECVVQVADEGTGISEEFLPLVFERFRQDTSSPGRNGGLGLGLAIVRNLVELHKGSVSVESEGEEKGAIFTVRFPLVERSE